MTTLAIAPESPPAPRLIAPIAHTIALVLLFLVMAAGGAIFQQRAAAHATTLPAPSRPTTLYLSLIAMEWGLVLYVVRGGLRRTGTSLRDVVGGRWSRPRDVVRDVVVALAAWGVWTLFSWIASRAAGPEHAASVRSLLPRHPIDLALWVALSLSAGFAEELVFRGYLFMQFRALIRSPGLALIMQSVLFGALALMNRSLRPGMIAHAWTDIAAGLFRI